MNEKHEKEQELQEATELIQKDIQKRVEGAREKYNRLLIDIQEEFGVDVGISNPQIIINPRF